MNYILLEISLGLIATVVVLALLCLVLSLKVLQGSKLIKRLNMMHGESLNQLEERDLVLLRTRTSPHFIFNSLSSINDYIMKEEPQQASQYVTKLSKLIRKTLDHSYEELITLEEEFQTLNLYVDLENERFDNKINFRIHRAPQIDPSTTLIPPMLIQPFVENAIKHGIRVKEHGGQIDLKIESYNSQLQIIILDDGIGRLEAIRNKDSINVGHKSHGLSITERRLSLLNKVSKIDSEIHIRDLENPSGTEITFKIALLRKSKADE